jgi:hypothetical protein
MLKATTTSPDASASRRSLKLASRRAHPSATFAVIASMATSA